MYCSREISQSRELSDYVNNIDVRDRGSQIKSTRMAAIFSRAKKASKDVVSHYIRINVVVGLG